MIFELDQNDFGRITTVINILSRQESLDEVNTLYE